MGGNIKVSAYLKFAGIAIGAIATLTLVAKHPVHVGMIIAGAAVYFIGEYFSKKGE